MMLWRRRLTPLRPVDPDRPRPAWQGASGRALVDPITGEHLWEVRPDDPFDPDVPVFAVRCNKRYEDGRRHAGLGGVHGSTYVYVRELAATRECPWCTIEALTAQFPQEAPR